MFSQPYEAAVLMTQYAWWTNSVSLVSDNQEVILDFCAVLMVMVETQERQTICGQNSAVNYRRSTNAGQVNTFKSQIS